MKLSELVAIFLLSTLTNLQCTLLAPIVPLELERRLISQIYSGLIMGSYSIGYILAPFLASSFLYSAYGRRAAAQLSLGLLAFALLLYALTYLIPDSLHFTFSLSCVILRVL